MSFVMVRMQRAVDIVDDWGALIENEVALINVLTKDYCITGRANPIACAVGLR